MKKHISRREFMKKSAIGLTALAVYRFIPTKRTANANEPEKHTENGKILIAYFSHSGNTREIANQIHNSAGGDIFEIQAVKIYPDDYEALKKVAKEELASEYKPALKTKIENIRSYDFIFIGYPIWWGTFPAPVRTFLSEYDFSGKTIVPFCTHLGSGLGQSITHISELCPESTSLVPCPISSDNFTCN